MSAEVVDVLKKARELVERGWCQGVASIRCDGLPTNSPHKSVLPIERVCAWGALIAATENNPDEWHPAEAELELGLAKAPNGYRTLVQWNDLLGRRKEEVLELYDRAIARLEGGS